MTEEEYKNKYSPDETVYTPELVERLDSVCSEIDSYCESGTLPKDSRFILPNAPLYLLRTGSDDTAITLPVSVVKKAIETHYFSKEEIQTAIKKLYDPVIVFNSDKSKTENKVDSRLILTDEFIAGKPVALTLNINSEVQFQKGGHRTILEVQDIRSIHDRTLIAKNGTDLVQKWTNDGLCRYVDDKKITDWSTVARVYFPIEVLQPAESNILKKSDFVNSQNAAQERNVALDESQEKTMTEDELTRLSLARQLKENMPSLDDSERAAAIAIMEAGAASMQMSLSDYVQNTFPDGVFGDFDITKDAAHQNGVEINGAVSVSGFGGNVRATIYASKTADFSTWVHELSHVWQAQLRGKLKSDAENAFQVKDGDWQKSIYTFEDGHTDTSAEAFAYGFEDFLKHNAGEMASEDKKKIFEKFADYMARTYNGTKQHIEISGEIAKVYESFVLLDDNILAEAEKAVRREKDNKEVAVNNTASVISETERQQQAVRSMYKESGQWLKAPNGKPSKLSEEQWVSVRTPNFKRWFGNWEYDGNKKVVPVELNLDSVEFNHNNASEVEKWLKEKLSGKSVEVSSSGAKVLFFNKGLQDSLKRHGEIQRGSYSVMESLIENAELFDFVANDGKDKHKGILGQDIYYSALKVDDKYYSVQFKFNVSGKYFTDSYKDHKISEIKIAPLVIPQERAEKEVSVASPAAPANAVTGANVSLSDTSEIKIAPLPYRGSNNAHADTSAIHSFTISELTGGVKPEFSKVIDENGEPLAVYHGSPNSGFDVFDRRKIGSTTDHGIYGKGFYFSNMKQQSEMYGNTTEVFLNIRNPLAIDDFHSPEELAETLDAYPEYFTVQNGRVKPTGSFTGFDSYLEAKNYDGVLVKQTESINEIVAFNPNQIKSATDNNGNFDRNNDSIYFQLAGERSILRMAESEEKERILSDLEAAKLMDEKYAGMDADSKAARIRFATGWEKSADGRWKYELDDSMSRIKSGSLFEKILSTSPQMLEQLTKNTSLTLDDILDSPELFKVFPFMKSVNVGFYSDPNAFRAVLTPDGIKVNTRYLDGTNGEKGLKGVLAHEIQHIIQAVEYSGTAGLHGESIEQLYNNMMEAMKAADAKRYDYDISSLENGLSEYMRDMGEVEARNVARRITMTATERRHTTLKSTEDVARNLQFQIIGERGATNLDRTEESNERISNLDTAKEMETAGRNEKIIRMATGWERGADSKWRYELDDSNIKTDFIDKSLKFIKDNPQYEELHNKLKSNNYDWEILTEKEQEEYEKLSDELSEQYYKKGVTLEEILDYEELFNAYPNLRKLPVSFIEKNPEREWGARTAFGENGNAMMIEFNGLPDEYNIEKYKSMLLHELQHVVQETEGFSLGGNPDSFLRVAENDAETMILDGKKYYDGYDAYRSLSGEVEARNVQKRMNMKSDIRNKTLLSETEDVPRGKQIMQYGKELESFFIPDEKEYESYQKQLDDYLSGKLKPSDFISLGKTPAVLEKIGVNQNEVVIFQNVIDKSLRQPQTDENGKFVQGHEIDISVLEKLPEYISDPLMVFKSDTVPNSKVIMTEYQDVNDRTVVVALHCDSRADSGKLVVNKISSIYRKDSDFFFLNQIKKGNLEYIDEKRSREWAVRQRLQLPPLTDILGYTSNLTTKEKFVNSHFQANLEQRNVALDESQEKNMETNENIHSEKATSYVLDKLQEAGIEVVTDKEVFNNILDSKEILQKSKTSALSPEEIQSYFSFKKSEVDDFNKLLDNWEQIKENPRQLLMVGYIPPVMKAIGIVDEPIEIESSTVSKALRPEPVYPGERQGHNLSMEDIRAIPGMLADPVMVFKSRTRNDSYVFFTERKDSENRSIIIPLAVNQRVGRIVINKVTSMYGRNNEADYVYSNIADNNLVYMDRERAEEWEKKISPADRRWLQKQYLGERSTKLTGLDTNILSKENLVNFLSSKQLMISDGTTYGFAYEGKIYLNPETLNSDVAVHEYTHLWDNYTRATNPELWEKGMDAFKKTSLWQEVKSDPNYADIANDDNLVLSECHARICGEVAQSVLERIAREDGEIARDAVIDWDKETWNYLAEKINLDISAFKDIGEFMSMPMKDLVQAKTIHIEESQEKNMETNENIQEWTWTHYEDGSGHLTSPDGKEYFQYDWSTKEYMENPQDGQWRSFMDADPERDTSLAAFKRYAEERIRQDYSQGSSLHFKEVHQKNEYENEMQPDLLYSSKSVVFTPENAKEFAEYTKDSDMELDEQRARRILDVLRKEKIVLEFDPTVNGLVVSGDVEKAGFVSNQVVDVGEMAASAELLEKQSVSDGFDKYAEQMQVNHGMNETAMEKEIKSQEKSRPDYLDEQGNPHWFDEEENTEIEKPEEMSELRESLKQALKETAEPLPELEFTRENYNLLFPRDHIKTPLGTVKLGEHQFDKLEERDRQFILQAAHDTLATPDIVISEKRQNVFGEEKDSHVYAKSFLFDDKVHGVQSVVVSIDGENVSITSHERDINNIVNKIKKPDQLLFAAAKVGLLVEQHTQNRFVQSVVNRTRENGYAGSLDSNIAQNASLSNEKIPVKQAEQTEQSFSVNQDGEIKKAGQVLPDYIKTLSRLEEKAKQEEMAQPQIQQEAQKKPSKKQEKTDFIKKGAEDFLRAVQNGTAPFLSEQNNDFGKITMTPQLIVNAQTGLAFKDEAQLLAQMYSSQQEMFGQIVVSMSGAKEAGTYIKKCDEAQKNFVLTNQNHLSGDNKVISTRYFSPEAAENPNMIYAEVLHKNRPAKLKAYRELAIHYENVPQGKKDVQNFMQKIAWEHRKEIQRALKLPDGWEKHTEKDIENFKEYIKNYFEKVPERERTVFQETFGICVDVKKEYGDAAFSDKTREIMENKLTDFIVKNSLTADKLNEFTKQEYDEFEQWKKEQGKQNKIEAVGIKEPEIYLGRYLAACNTHSEFVTDAETIKTVREKLSMKLQQNYKLEKFEILKEIGMQAGRICNETVKQQVFSEAHSHEKKQELVMQPDKQHPPIGRGA